MAIAADDAILRSVVWLSQLPMRFFTVSCGYRACRCASSKGCRDFTADAAAVAVGIGVGVGVEVGVGVVVEVGVGVGVGVRSRSGK